MILFVLPLSWMNCLFYMGLMEIVPHVRFSLFFLALLLLWLTVLMLFTPIYS